MAVYKVSYVVISSDHPGAIVNRDQLPVIGEKVTLGKLTFEVIEVLELMPPRGQFYYIHATLKPVSKTGKTPSRSDR
jgi:hypothetical protein